MELRELRKHWDTFGKTDPLWAIMAWPDKRGGRWDLAEFFATGRADVERVLAHLDARGIASNRGTALDFGCGVGRLTQALCGPFGRCVGVDIAGSMIEQARRLNRHGDRCRYVLNRADDLRCLESGTFDLVFSLIVLQHMQPAYIKGYLEEFFRVAAPGGLVVFQVPSRPAREGVRAHQATVLPPPPHGLAGLRDRLRRFARRDSGPIVPEMQMYCIPRDEVVRFVEEQGGKVLDVAENRMCGDDFESFQYVARK